MFLSLVPPITLVFDKHKRQIIHMFTDMSKCEGNRVYFYQKYQMLSFNF